MYDDYEPTPRICIDFVNSPDIFVWYKELHDEASLSPLMEKYEDILTNSKLLDLDDASQTI